MVFQHEFSWSASRAGGFATCRRRYYYDYYFSWGGWNASAPEPRRKTYLLKKMTRMPMLAGDLVHQVIQRWFEGREQGRVGTLEESIGWVTDQLRAKYRESRDGDWKMRPAKLCHLAEHHYHEACVDESGTQAADYGRRFLERMNAALTCFFGSPDLEQVRQMDPQNILACEAMSTFELFGTKIYAVPDLAYRDGPSRVQILDWKTGSPREADRFQLAIYAFFAQDKWGAEPTQVVCKDVYLGRNEIVEQAYSDQQLEEVMGRIEDSMAQMRALHFDADAGPGEPQDFPMTAEDEEGLRECRSCNYRELCARP